MWETVIGCAQAARRDRVAQGLDASIADVPGSLAGMADSWPTSAFHNGLNLVQLQQ